MIIQLYLPAVCPPFYRGQAVTVANGRTGIIHRITGTSIRVLVNCGLSFPVPQYFTVEQLTAHKQAAPTPAADQRAA